MIRVHPQQLEAMSAALTRERFEERMQVHLPRFAPRPAAALGEEGVRQVVLLGIDRARAYGVENPGLLRFYVEMMFLFGSMFDTDPLLPWAGAILRDPALADEAARSVRLYEAMRAYRDAVDGPARTGARDGLRRLAETSAEPIPVAQLLDEDGALDAIRRLHPALAAHVGEEPLRELVRRAPEVAARLGLGTPRGHLLVTALAVTLGHGFADDPLFPWVRATLSDTASASAEARVAALWTKAARALDEALEGGQRAGGFVGAP